MKKLYLLVAMCAAFFTISTSAVAIEINTYAETFQYYWSTYAGAQYNGVEESSDSSANLQYNDWYNPTYSNNYSGSVAGPISGKTYDTSPVNFLQRDGTQDTSIRFDESWIYGDAQVGVSESGAWGSSYGININSSSTAIAAHSLDSYFFGTTGEASSYATVAVSVPFDLYTMPGEANTFTLNGGYINNIFANVLVSAGALDPDYSSFLNLTQSVTLRNATTNETLFDDYYDASLGYDAWAIKDGTLGNAFTLNDLSTLDTYQLDIVLTTEAVAQSSKEFILEDPSCDPNIETCVIDYTAYYDESSISATSLSFNLDAQSSVVPVPAAVWLFGSGLLGLIGVARRKKA